MTLDFVIQMWQAQKLQIISRNDFKSKVILHKNPNLLQDLNKIFQLKNKQNTDKDIQQIHIT